MLSVWHCLKCVVAICYCMLVIQTFWKLINLIKNFASPMWGEIIKCKVTSSDFMGVSWKKEVTVRINIRNYVCVCRKEEIFTFHYVSECHNLVMKSEEADFSAVIQCCHPKFCHLFSLLRSLCSLNPIVMYQLLYRRSYLGTGWWNTSFSALKIARIFSRNLSTCVLKFIYSWNCILYGRNQKM